MKQGLNNFLFEPGSSKVLAFARMCITLFCYIYLTREFHPEYPDGGFYLTWTPNGLFSLLSGPVEKIYYDYGLLIFKCSLIAAFFGLGSRFSLLTAFLSGFWVHGYFTCFSNEVYHHSHMAIMSLGILCLGPVNDSLSLDNIIKGRSFFEERFDSSYQYPMSLLLTWVILLYFTAGYQKLIHGSGLEWAFSQNLRIRLIMSPQLTQIGEWLSQQADFILYFFAFCGLMVEVLAPLVFLKRKIIFIFIPLWIGLHIFVLNTFGEHRAFFSQIGCYLALVPFVIKSELGRSKND